MDSLRCRKASWWVGVQLNLTCCPVSSVIGLAMFVKFLINFWKFCLSPSQYSLCSSSFLQIGQCGPREHFSVVSLGITMAQWIAAILGGSSVLMVGVCVGTGVGGIG